jgi:hypothetical protein
MTNGAPHVAAASGGPTCGPWWTGDGTLDRIHDALYVECCEKVEREAGPTACIIDSQLVGRGNLFGAVNVINTLVLDADGSQSLMAHQEKNMCSARE